MKLLFKICGFIIYLVSSFLIIFLLWQNYEVQKRSLDEYQRAMDANTRYTFHRSIIAEQNQKLILEMIDAGERQHETMRKILSLIEEHRDKK